MPPNAWEGRGAPCCCTYHEESETNGLGGWGEGEVKMGSSSQPLMLHPLQTHFGGHAAVGSGTVSFSVKC